MGAQCCGRFAPTPSGPLHFGSLVTAVASYLSAKSSGGNWLLRIEDVDEERCHQRHVTDILKTLEKFGLCWDGEVVYQSQRTQIYDDVLQTLLKQGDAYFCTCSRKDVGLGRGVGVDGAPIYGRTCLFLGCSKAKPKAIRLKTAGSVKKFQDRVFGELSQNVDTEVGDFVIRRSDGFYAYHLAVVVDDALQGVTEIVRGYDLFVSTPRHLLLQERLRFFHPSYAHVPLVLNEGGEKLSKQTLAPALNADKIVDLLFACLNFLGQRANAAWRHETPEQILRMAAMEWDWNLVPKVPGKVTRWE